MIDTLDLFQILVDMSDLEHLDQFSLLNNMNLNNFDGQTQRFSMVVCNNQHTAGHVMVILINHQLAQLDLLYEFFSELS